LERLGLNGFSHLYQNVQDSRLAGTKPLDLHVQLLQLQGRLLGPILFIKMSKYVYEFKFPTISNGPII
jgi:hypothetical protein